MNTKPVTKRQQQIFEFIQSFLDEKGYPPTIREIGRGIDLSISCVHRHIEKLQDKGVIEVAPGTPRAIKLIKTNVSDKQSLSEENKYLRAALKEIKESTSGYTLPTCFENQLNQIADKALKG